MPDLTSEQEAALHKVAEDVEALRRRIQALHAETQYEDLDHADLGLQIADHAIEEVLEHKGLGGEMPRETNAAAHEKAESWLRDVKRIQAEAGEFLRQQPNEDLETALKALTIAAGSFEEVVERYE